jgi:hypothetical protein
MKVCLSIGPFEPLFTYHLFTAAFASPDLFLFRLFSPPFLICSIRAPVVAIALARNPPPKSKVNLNRQIGWRDQVNLAQNYDANNGWHSTDARRYFKQSEIVLYRQQPN